VATRHSVPSPLALVVNYPSNPTAQVVDLDFYKEVIKFARKHEIWVLSDLCLCDIYFDDANPRPRSCRWMAPRISPSNSSLCPRPIPCPAGAWALPPAMKKLIGALAPHQVVS